LKLLNEAGRKNKGEKKQKAKDSRVGTTKLEHENG
jgi:hypothetical protein